MHLKINYLEELLGGFDIPRIAHNRLQNDSSNLSLVLVKEGLDRVQVVVSGCQSGSYKAVRIHVQQVALYPQLP